MLFLKTDISSPEAIKEAANTIRAKLGKPSILFNNAGIGGPGDLFDTKPAALQKLFAVNTLSHWYTVQEFVPDMITNNKGHIISTASLASFGTIANHIQYAASKAGALSFHEGEET